MQPGHQMGLGIHIDASYAGTEEECRGKLRAFLGQLPPVVPGRVVSVLEYNETIRAGMFFAEEDVYFQFTDDGRLAINAKTNGAGPGYHAYLADVFERLRTACALSWNDDDVEDETGYWHGRDFEELQHTMADWLESLAGMLVQHHMNDGSFGLAICMGTERVPDDASRYAAHLLGWRDRDYFRAMFHDGPSPTDCAAFFIWWTRERNAEFYLKCALAMMWCDCNWLPPETDLETRLYTAVFLCLESAWDSNPKLHFPVLEWKEMALLSDSGDIIQELERRFPAEVPRREPIGYLRGNVRHDLGSGWRITLPGAMHEELDGEDGTVLVYWDSLHTIRVSRFTVTGENINARDLLDTITENVEAAVDFSVRDTKDILARIAHEPQAGEDGKDYFGSFFFAAVDAGRVLYISIFYDKEDDRDWAEQVFASCSWQDN